MSLPNIGKVLNHFEISENNEEDLSIFDSTKIEKIGALVAFELSKKKGRAIIDYDPAYQFAILRICTKSAEKGNVSEKEQNALPENKVTALKNSIVEECRNQGFTLSEYVRLVDSLRFV